MDDGELSKSQDRKTRKGVSGQKQLAQGGPFCARHSDLFYLQLELFCLQFWLLYLQLEFFCLQWESASKKGPSGTVSKEA